MKLKNIFRSFAALALSAVMALAPVSPVPVFADTTDIVDTNRKGSITIHKYDITAAQEDHLDVDYESDGKQNTTAEEALKDYVIQGVKFTFLKVSDIIQESENGKVSLKFYIDSDLEDILELEHAEDQRHTSEELNNALKHILEAGNTEAKNKLEKYIMTGAGSKTTEETNEEGIIKLNDVALGLYLFVETEVPANVHTTVDPFFVLVPMTDVTGDEWFYDIHLYPKNQTNMPTLDKQVRQDDDVVNGTDTEWHDTVTASEGDKVDYLIISHLPSITSTATYLTDYTFTDYMDDSLVYNRDAQIAIYASEEDAKAGENAKYTFVDGSDYNATYSTETAYRDEGVSGEDGPSYEGISSYFEGPDFEGSGYGQGSSGSGSSGSSSSSGSPDGAEGAPGGAPPAAAFKNRVHVIFKFTEAGLEKINTLYSNMWIAIHYSATMHSDETVKLGDTGNTNDVDLTWKRTNEHYPDHEDARARVFTYGFNITKVFTTDDEHQKPDYKQAQFVLWNETDQYFVTATWDTGITGLYYVTDKKKAKTEDEATKFTPNDKGGLVIYGLEADTYVLTEIHTEAGYSLLKEPITIVISPTEDTFTPSLTTLYDKKDEYRELKEENGDRASSTVDESPAEMSPQDLDDRDSSNAFVDMTITNTPGFKLPATGGLGTILFTIAGCGIAFLGIAFLTKKDKKDKEEQ